MTVENDFWVKLDSTTQLSTILTSISFKQKAQIQISAQGLMFSIHDQQCLQVIAYFNASSALEFHAEQEMDFMIDVNTLFDCLTIFGTETSGVSCVLRHEVGENVLIIE